MDERDRKKPSAEIYASFIDATVGELAKKDWLGDVAAFPEIQTDLDALQQRVVEMKLDTAVYQEALQVFERTGKEDILERNIKPIVNNLSRDYSQILQAMGKISFDIDARYTAQYLHNIELTPGQQETPASAEAIQAGQAIVRPERDMFDSVRDTMPKTTKASEKISLMKAMNDWLGKDPAHVESLDGTLLKDLEGFKAAAMKTGRPLEAKLHVLEVLVGNIVGVIEQGCRHFSTLKAGLESESDERKGGKSFP
jgi:hypothetical protein